MDINQQIKAYFEKESTKAELFADFEKLISIKSIASEQDGDMPFGKGSCEALQAALALGKKYGFKTYNHDNYCGSVIYGDGELEVGIITHLDVVPVSDGWNSDPFKLEKRNGKYYGRGTIDDKGPFIQALYTLRFLSENQIKLPFAIRLILGSDEEVGCNDLEHFVKVCTPPAFSFTPDAAFPVCIGEKSIASAEITLPNLPAYIKEINGGEVSNAVPAKASAVLAYGGNLPAAPEGVTVEPQTNGDILVTATGIATHASTPETGINAISRLAKYLLLLDNAYENAALRFIAATCGDIYGETLGIAAENSDFGKLTCVGTLLGMESGTTKLLFNIRYLPDTESEELISAIRASVEPKGCKARLCGHVSKGYFIDCNDKKIKALTAACAETEGCESTPYTMGGGTYARHIPNAVAFGAIIDSERELMPAGTGGAHQRDECITEKELLEGIRIYIKALVNLASSGL